MGQYDLLCCVTSIISIIPLKNESVSVAVQFLIAVVVVVVGEVTVAASPSQKWFMLNEAMSSNQKWSNMIISETICPMLHILGTTCA